MVNSPPPSVGTSHAAERALAVGYASTAVRPGLDALLALDETLGNIVRSTREPIVGQMRLTWWHQALSALDTAPPPAEPVLQALAASVVPGVAGTRLAAMIDGWEALLEPVLDDAAIDLFAQMRGGGLFDVMALLSGVDDPRVAVAGQGWALADLSRRISDPLLAATIGQRALARLDAALVGTWPRRARALGALALLARADLQGIAAASPKRIGRILIHRLTGR
jgi:phytoene synthase